ncbi:hypothetical protein ACVINH_005893 [Rhizobium anhuiense]
MPRLFWKFFATIWLTLAMTLTVIIVIVNLFQIPAAWPRSGIPGASDHSEADRERPRKGWGGRRRALHPLK